jgi:hypothetical protein
MDGNKCPIGVLIVEGLDVFLALFLATNIIWVDLFPDPFQQVFDSEVNGKGDNED